MPRFPYVNVPPSYYRKFPRYPNNSNQFSNKLSSSPKGSTHSTSPVINCNNNTSSTLENKNKSNSNNLNYMFDLFGLEIFFDDILILSLLFFLYSEGVKDDMLFISLLLLLIS